MTSATATTWKADPAHSTTMFAVRNFFGTVSGRCDLAGARVDYDEAGRAAVEATIDAASIATGSEQRDGHLRSEELLNTAAYPTIVFRSTDFELDDTEEKPTGRLAGDLTVRDVTRNVSLRLTLLGRDVFPLNGAEAMVVAGETELSRSDFGVSFNMPWKNRMLMGDKVDVRVELLLLRDGEGASTD